MNKGKIYLLVALSLASATTFAAKERAIRVQNTVRVGYDDNVYQDNGNVSSAFVTDIINISGKMTFSSRSDMLLYWQPEFRYRMDADPEMVTYQDLYARFNHAISQRTFLKISDRFRYQQKDGQTGGGVDRANQNFFENDLLGALDFTLSPKGQINLGAGYEFRVWDDENYGKGVQGNNYDQFKANGSYIRELKPNRTQGLLGINYVDHAYDGSRGGFNSTTVFAGVDQNFNANVIGNARLGYSFSNVDGGSATGDSDTSSPYLQAGLDVNPTARTSFTGSLGYSLYQSDNSVYNAQDRFSLGLGVRHDLTGKVSLSSSITYIYSLYDADYARGGGVIDDAQDDYFVFNLRGSYQINRNNFVDAGYQYSNRNSDSAFLNEYDRNVVDIGWRLRL